MHGKSQCTPDANCSFTQVLCPSSLASGCAATSYSQVITVAAPASITYNGGTYPIVRIKLNSIVGLPTGVTYTCNPSNCTFNGNSRGCITISGTPATAGSYPLTANTTVTIQISIFQAPYDTALALGALVIIPKDCAGVCGGAATVDNCGRCSGGTTGILPNCNDNDACTQDACNGQGGCTNTQNCVTLSGKIQTETGTGIPGVTVSLTGSQAQSVTTTSNGLYSFTVIRNGNYTITPSKSNDVTTNNGITTLDVSLIRSHVLGNPRLNSPYKTIAADGSNSQTITTVDISTVRTVILNNTAKFPGNRLWEFVSSAQTFTTPQPGSAHQPYPLTKTRTYDNVTQSFTDQNFIGVKIGDVNNSWNSATP